MKRNVFALLSALRKVKSRILAISIALGLFASLSSCSQQDAVKLDTQPVMIEARMDDGDGQYPFSLMTIKVEGQTAQMIVDTSASSISLQVEFFDELKKLGLLQTASTAALGESVADDAEREKLKIQLGDHESFTINTSTILQNRKFPGAPNFDGSLNPAIFGLFGCAEVNFKDNILIAYALREGEVCPFQLPANAIQLDYRPVPMATLTRSGQKLTVLLDSSTSISIFEADFLNAANKRFGDVKVNSPLGLLNGTSAGPVLIKLGDVEVEIESAVFTDPLLGFTGGGVVGFDVLKHSTWYYVGTSVYFADLSGVN